MRRVTAMLAAVVLLVGLGGCKPRTVTDTSRQLYCQVIPDAPDPDNSDDPKKIIGRVRYYCDPPGVDKLALTLRLQKQNSKGTWVDVAKVSLNARTSQTTMPDKDIYRSKEVVAPCSTGTFRMLVKGSSSARGHTSTYDLTGPRQSDPCKPGIFAPDK